MPGERREPETAAEYVARKRAQADKHGAFAQAKTCSALDQQAAEIKENFPHLLMALLAPKAVDELPDPENEKKRMSMLFQTAVTFAIGVALEWDKYERREG